MPLSEKVEPMSFFGFSKIFQNLRVSSPAADAIVVPSGLKETCKTHF